MLERPLALQANQPVRLRVLADGTIFEVYVDDKVALSSRGYAHTTGNWGVYVHQGAASFSNLGMAAI